MKGNFQSYKDTKGYVSFEGDFVYRYVRKEVSTDFIDFLNHPVAERLVRQGLLLAYERDESHCTEEYLVLKSEKIPFVSYPYEWSFDQLKEAALLTLELNIQLLREGFILRDATAFNILFQRGRAVFVDHLSIGRHSEGEPWMAYSQFCRFFLAPLAVMKYRDWNVIGLFQAYLDGLPLETVVSNLPIKSLFHPALLVHLHLQASISIRKASRRKLIDKTYFSKEKLLLLFEQLQHFFRKIEPYKPKNSAWYDYYDNTILSQEYLAEKECIVREILKENPVHTILDAGANDGYFSFVALEYAKQVVAVEYDHHCVNNLHKRVKKEKKNIFTLISGITNPSPALGFLNKEKYSLLDRLKGTDLTLALAVTHHLRIGFNVPFHLQAELFKSFSKKLIVEYVPKEDPKCQELLLNREDVFDDYSQERFVHSFVESGFVLKKESCLSSVNRILYVFEMEES